MSFSSIVDQVVCDEQQLTNDAFGHCINNTQCFSPDGTKIVYDTRNEDSGLAANGQIRMINIRTGEDVLLYETVGQSEYGPGAGAATFSPDGKHVLFLRGLQNSSKENPYSFTRRTGIAVALENPGVPIYMDARDIRPPFTTGALRGGTHAHAWSGDGQMICFTYNDYVLSQEAKINESIIDSRTVGIMFPRKVDVKNADGIENISGQCFSALIAHIVKDPKPGSDEISKAFDECWIGTDGYLKPDGTRQKKAISFQGHVAGPDGKLNTAIFVADIPDDIRQTIVGLSPGTMTTMPAIPGEIIQRRITGDDISVSEKPRHWLRSTPDGSMIGFLAADAGGIIQLWGIPTNGGYPRQLTFLPSSVTGQFNFSPDGKYAAFIAGSAVNITRLSDGKTFAISDRKEPGDFAGPVVWSPNSRELAYNRYKTDKRGRFLQIFLVKLPDLLLY